jgi:RimJ/RimL family protein N-acetyltransferase
LAILNIKNQNRGYGREAMKKILEFTRTFPAGLAHYCWIPYKSDNIAAKKLYESFGFRDNGEVFNNESITVCIATLIAVKLLEFIMLCVLRKNYRRTIVEESELKGRAPQKGRPQNLPLQTARGTLP